jgi:hypothetical protein
MKSLLSPIRRKAVSGVGVVLSMFLVLTLLTGAAMPPAAGGAVGGMEQEAAMPASAAAYETASTPGAAVPGLPESIAARIAEARPPYHLG